MKYVIIGWAIGTVVTAGATLWVLGPNPESWAAYVIVLVTVTGGLLGGLTALFLDIKDKL